MTFAPLGKKLMIESQVGNGRCYLRLIPALPNYNRCQPEDLELAIVGMTQELGSNPLGKDILIELLVANEILAGLATPEQPNGDQFDRLLFGANAAITGSFIDEMFKAHVRFGFEELNGVKHVSHFISMDESDDVEEVLNNYGWSTKYILCAITSVGVRVGASMDEVNLDELFASLVPTMLEIPKLRQSSGDSSECDTIVAGKINKENVDTPIEIDTNFIHGIVNKPVKDFTVEDSIVMVETIDDQYGEIERLNLKIKMMEEGIQRGRQNKSVANPSSARASHIGEPSVRAGSKPSVEVESTISPLDSSSQISRYGRAFMGNGTILTLSNTGRPRLEPVSEASKDLCVSPLTIARGYVKTQKMQVKENSKLRDMRPINGLSIPFKSQRLNLLCHFHTAVEGIMRSSSQDRTVYEVLKVLHKYVSKTPSEELAHRMIVDTFDLEESVVCANPYCFPFIEIGMSLSDDCLNKTMDMLRLEYKVLWFNEFKSLRVPDFHSDYRKYKDSKLSITKTQDRRSSGTSQKLKTSPTSSILSVMKGAGSRRLYKG